MPNKDVPFGFSNSVDPLHVHYGINISCWSKKLITKYPLVHVPVPPSKHDGNALIKHGYKIVGPLVSYEPRRRSDLNLVQPNAHHVVVVHKQAVVIINPYILNRGYLDLNISVYIQKVPTRKELNNCNPFTIRTNPMLLLRIAIATRQRSGCGGRIQRHHHRVNTL